MENERSFIENERFFSAKKRYFSINERYVSINERYFTFAISVLLAPTPRSMTTRKEERALADYIELSLQLQCNSRGR